MPTYAYRCRDCGHQFDIFQRFSEDPLTVCPVCEGAIRRVIQPTGVVFKGTGFYINDSRNSAKNGSDKAKTAADASGATAANDSGGDTSGKVDGPADKPATESGKSDKVTSDKPVTGKNEPTSRPAAERTPAAARASDG